MTIAHFDTVVLGGGISGLIAALLVRESDSDGSIIVFESSERLGGAVAGSQFLGSDFDLGTHIFQETGVNRVDGLLRQAVGEANLNVMDSSEGDRAGTIVDDRIYQDTQYLNLSELNRDLAIHVVDHVTQGASSVEALSFSGVRHRPIATVANSWFGRHTTDSILLPTISKWFGDPEPLSGFALELANLTRLQAANESVWQHHARSRWFRMRIAYPDQKRLPLEFRHTRKSLYPRYGSSQKFVDGLKKMCIFSNIKIATKTRLSHVDLVTRRASISGETLSGQLSFRRLVSTLGPLSTVSLIGGGTGVQADRVETRIVNHLLSSPTDSDLCYLYVHTRNTPVFRITNYRAFSGHSDDRRLTTELISPAQLTDDRVILEAEKILYGSGLLNGNSKVKSEIVPYPGGFPRPTVAMFGAYLAASRDLEPLTSDDFVVSGVGAAGSVFFQNEVLLHLHSKLM